MRVILDHSLRTVVVTIRSNGFARIIATSIANPVAMMPNAITMVSANMSFTHTNTLSTPSNLPREDSMFQIHLSTNTSTRERSSAVQWDMVSAPVPNRSVDHAVGGESHDCTDDGAGETVIPVVEFVDSESACNEGCAEDRSVRCDEFPHCWARRGDKGQHDHPWEEMGNDRKEGEDILIIRPDLQLSIQVDTQEHETRERSRRMSTREALQRIINLTLITRANRPVIHNLSQSIPRLLCRDSRDIRFADCEEMWTQTTNQPFEKDLEDGSSDEGVEEPDGSIIDVPEGADPDLHDQEDGDGDERGEECGGPDGNDLVAHRVGELRVDDFAVLEVDGEGS